VVNLDIFPLQRAKTVAIFSCFWANWLMKGPAPEGYTVKPGRRRGEKFYYRYLSGWVYSWKK
jgi:hypothetical protein